MKEYTATIKVTRFYEIDFASPDFTQAMEDAEILIEDEVFDENCIKEEIKIVGLKHDHHDSLGDGIEIKRDSK
jgi:hypothetical protein